MFFAKPLIKESRHRFSLEKRFGFLVLVLTVALEAIAAIYGTIATGLEGHLGGRAAAITNDFEHLTVTTVRVLAVAASATASGATAGLVLEALVSKELLFGRGEYELGTAIAASQGFVFKHG